MKILISLLIIAFLLSQLGVSDGPKTKWWRSRFDSTDDAQNNKRSGLALFIDYGTGCHYIKAPFGQLIPRMGADGKQVCTKEGE